MSLSTTSVVGAEPTDAMRTFAKLEARDLESYCTAKHGVAYTSYLERVCQSAVQNRVKNPEDCSPENIAQQSKSDTEQCLAMPAAEFEKTMLRGREGGQAFLKELAAQSIDGEKLLQEERAKIH